MKPQTEYARSGDNHIASRLVSMAAPGEVLASSTVRDRGPRGWRADSEWKSSAGVAGSGIEFVGRGAHALRGVPGEWQVYAAA